MLEMSKHRYHSSSFISFGFGSSPAYSEKSPLKYNKTWSTYPVPKTPTNNCIFCHEFHWSHLCLEVPTLELRYGVFETFKLCEICGKKRHSGSCSSGDIWCKWPQCAAKNEHNTTLCPNVPYPITEELVQAYEDHVAYVWELRESTNSYSDSASQNISSSKKDRKRNRKLSSNAKTLTFGYRSNNFGIEQNK